MRNYVFVLFLLCSGIITGSELPENSRNKQRRNNKNDCYQPKWAKKAQKRANHRNGENFKNLRGPVSYDLPPRYKRSCKVGSEDSVNL